jgi:hypothetical protein
MELSLLVWGEKKMQETLVGAEGCVRLELFQEEVISG